MINFATRWKTLLLVVMVGLGCLYALPNLYGEVPALQISMPGGGALSPDLAAQVQQVLQQHQLQANRIRPVEDTLLVEFKDTESQLKANPLVAAHLGHDYSVALNLTPLTPGWLTQIGAKPMKLGLDLRGGLRFLMAVDVDTVIDRRLESEYNEIRTKWRRQKLRYQKLAQRKQYILANFAEPETRVQAEAFLQREFPHLDVVVQTGQADALLIRLSSEVVQSIRNGTLDQTLATLRNRVNELGVAEAIVQRQGKNQVVVELPGIQDTARAKDILGKTATLDFVMVDHEHSLEQAMAGRVPPGSRLLKDRYGRDVLLRKRVILTGDSITGASSAFDSHSGGPAVNIRLSGSGVGLFSDTTARNIGRSMAVIYRESKLVATVAGQAPQVQTEESIISVATIQNALGNNFQITGLSMQESRDLALLLRAGALPANLSIIEERVIGPSMGHENIRMGQVSVLVGLGLVLVFMGLYYSVFGLLANIALLFNLVLLVAAMSLFGATLTLPGIAGIVLTLGMAVDANVLIFERIREELKLGIAPKSSIHRGFEHAFATIVDANLTTLIVGIILFSIGSGPVKGFAVTLCLGILTSMFTAITGTRELVRALYALVPLKKVPVGV